MPSPRRETVTRIEKLVGAEEHSIRDPKLSSMTVHKVFDVLVEGEDRRPFKGRAWHIRKMLDAAGIESNKGFYRDGAQIPLKELQELEEVLQEAL